MKYRVILSPQACADAEEIYRYIAVQARAPTNAGRWLDGFYKVIGTLDDMPARCPEARENHLFQDDLRQLQYKSHRIIFRIIANDVHVLHVRHHGRKDMTKEDLEP